MKAFVDNSLGFRGRVVVALLDAEGKEIDRELVLKHPMGLRIRCWFASLRMQARQRKLAMLNS